MKITHRQNLKNKNLIVFDLDGTLAPSKSTIDKEMNRLLERLLMQKNVAVIGGGKLELFKHQLLNRLKVPKDLLTKLFLFPVTATSFFRYNNGWKNIYTHNLTADQVDRIMSAFTKVFKEIDYKKPEKTYGETIENRGSQITWSALGQDVVKVLGDKGVELKNKWRDKNTPLKLKIAKLLQKYLPDLEVHAAGYTSIDITKKGIDKAYGLKQMEKFLKVKIKNMVFIGDAIFPGGNDYAITKTPVDYFAIKDPEEAKKVIRKILKPA
ncbi:HAD-IIB family hydrolase [Candidatus Curtissbacteria bacterium]|nr:HAD-IIB family hydrolase [Candidatus Curtissbacteria bacterium]